MLIHQFVYELTTLDPFNFNICKVYHFRSWGYSLAYVMPRGGILYKNDIGAVCSHIKQLNKGSFVTSSFEC